MSQALFTDGDVWEGDPTAPGRNAPTPPEVVARLTRGDREKRVQALIHQAFEIYDEALAVHAAGREVVATCLLYSGGNDSTTLAHLFRPRADYAVHVDTTIGIERTRTFVRDTCEEWGLPLLERRPPEDYRALVLAHGFPGPAMHWKMYQRLKERALRGVVRELGAGRSRTKAVVFLAGRRRSESARRTTIVDHERDGATVWVSPLVNWTKLDLSTYRLMAGDVPVNPVSDLLHMSGECLCGAFAKPGELDEIGYWFPEVAAGIRALEGEVRAAGHAEPLCRWGHGEGRKPKQVAMVGMLCSSCEPPLAMFELE